MSEELERGILKGTIIGKVEFTEEEKKQNDEKCEKLLKKLGVLEENESIQDFKVEK